MKLLLVMKGLPQNKKELLEADLKHLKVQLQDDVHEAYLKLKHNRGFLFRTANILKKFSKSQQITMDMLRIALESFTGLEIFKYNIQYVDSITNVEMEVIDEYFLLTQQMSGFLGRLVGNDKKGFIKMIEHEARKTYTEDFKLEEVGVSVPNIKNTT